MMFDVFGEMNTAVKFFIAFAVVLALIALTAWLVRRFGANRLGGTSRGRQPRLAVIDAAAVDGRRRLVLIRRDNTEHLLMIGGPTDVVVEQNIVRASSAIAGREPARAADSTLPRAIPLADAGAWPLQPESAPVAVQATASRPYRAAVTEEPWVPTDAPAQPAPRARATELPPAAPEIPVRAAEPAPMRAAPPITTPVRDAAPSESSAAPALPPQTDRNLAEMAQRLEAALRVPNAADAHPPVSDPLAAAAAARSVEPRAPLRASRPEPRPVPPMPPTPPAAPAPSAGAFDSLEQEMASLLGRPAGKT